MFCYYVILLLSLNVKKLGSPLKRSHIRDFLKIYDIDVALLQESKTAFPSDSFLKSLGGSFNSCWRHWNSSGASGEQLIGWHDNTFSYTNEVVGEFLISIKLTNCRTSQQFVVTLINGSCAEGHIVGFGKNFETPKVGRWDRG